MPRKRKKGANFLTPEIETDRVRFEAYLNAFGLRFTKQREIIFEEVFRHHTHLDAEEIVRGLREHGKPASRATVYRTLDLLVEAGLVKPLRFGSKQHYYEHIHPGEHHDHLVCTLCGEVIEFFSSNLEDCQNQICDEKDFTAERHTMVIFGVCSNCRKKGH